MKRIAISLLLILTLILSMALVACTDDDEYDEYEEFIPNNTEKEPIPEDDPVEETEADDVLGVGADTDDSWGAIQRN